MTKVVDVVSALAERTRPQDAAAWDPVGLQLGDPNATANHVGVCHEVTEEVVERVESMSIDLLVTYHPLLFDPVNRLIAGRSSSARAFRMIRAGVSVIVTHTDFDAAPGGTADALARVFNLRDVRPFAADEDQGLPAIGRIGSFEGSVGTVDAMAADRLGQSGLRVSGDRSRVVEKLAVIPGSGSEFIADAIAADADALVTGDVSHHRVVGALDLGLAIIDPGHIATERPGMGALAALVADIVGNGIEDLTEIDPQTW